jgi:hypothetical protein
VSVSLCVSVCLYVGGGGPVHVPVTCTVLIFIWLPHSIVISSFSSTHQLASVSVSVSINEYQLVSVSVSVSIS